MRAIGGRRGKTREESADSNRGSERISRHGGLLAGACDHLPICPRIDHTGGFGLRSCLTMVAWRLNRTPGGDCLLA
jgi:hypothetical protein